MIGFEQPLLMESIHGTNFSISQRRVMRPLRWTGIVGNRTIDLTVPKGFVFDGASIPRIAWSIIGGPFGPYADAAALHDCAYRMSDIAMTRLEADRMFAAAMADLRITPWRRHVMYRAVRIGGASGFQPRID